MVMYSKKRAESSPQVHRVLAASQLEEKERLATAKAVGIVKT